MRTILSLLVRRCFEFLAIGLAMIAASTSVAWAFEDQGCSRIVTTKQRPTVEFTAGDTYDTVRTKAIDQAIRDAVDEVIGQAIESNRADDVQVVDDQVKSQFRTAARSSYKGLVRVKINDVEQTGIDQKKIDLDADVAVCVPKPETVIALERERAEKDKQPPRQVDPDKADWFNPVNGEAQIWYWQGPNQTYEFYDKGGFHPASGDPLVQVDRKFAKDWRALIAQQRKEAEDKQIADQKEQSRRQAAEAAARQRAAVAEEQASRSEDECDRSAANPNDPKKPAGVTGVRWDDLKTSSSAAIENCEMAVQRTPSEPRFRYQLARAYSVSDPKRALVMFKRLADEHYPAAYDNYGWSLLDRRVGRNDLDGAVRAWEAGVHAGDSDAMTSIATFMLKGQVDQTYDGEAQALLRRAANMGNQDASAAIERLDAVAAQEAASRAQQQLQQEQQARQQEQAARMFMGIVGGALGNVGRR